jgi:hypothetical protein
MKVEHRKGLFGSAKMVIGKETEAIFWWAPSVCQQLCYPTLPQVSLHVSPTIGEKWLKPMHTHACFHNSQLSMSGGTTSSESDNSGWNIFKNYTCTESVQILSPAFIP